ncbi:hypothetical protein [Burkholderia territorii]|nr:hypothetical protein [Burkholderia territorii]
MVHHENGDPRCIATATQVFVTEPIAAESGIEHLFGIALDADRGMPGG